MTDDSNKFVDDLKKDAKVFFNPGAEFGGTGNTFIRMNLACPRAMLKEALERLKRYINS